jgi:hypothetical protein
LYAISI